MRGNRAIIGVKNDTFQSEGLIAFEDEPDRLLNGPGTSDQCAQADFDDFTEESTSDGTLTIEDSP